MGKALNAAPLPQGQRQGLADGYANVFIAVVIVDVGIARGAYLQIKKAVAAELLQHVVEESHPGVQLALAAAI
jgi:hypothetical protein